jgi:hypothetical protein
MATYSITVVYGYAGYFSGPNVTGMMNSTITKTLTYYLSSLENSVNVTARLVDAANEARKELVWHPEFCPNWPAADRRIYEGVLHIISHSINIAATEIEVEEGETDV